MNDINITRLTCESGYILSKSSSIRLVQFQLLGYYDTYSYYDEISEFDIMAGGIAVAAYRKSSIENCIYFGNFVQAKNTAIWASNKENRRAFSDYLAVFENNLINCYVYDQYDNNFNSAFFYLNTVDWSGVWDFNNLSVKNGRLPKLSEQPLS